MPPAFATFMPHAHGLDDPRVQLREATEEDVSAIVAIDATRGPRKPGHAEWVLERITNPAKLVLVAVLDDVVVGETATHWWTGHDDAPDGYYVSGVTVLPEWRRHGAGTRLLDALTAWIWDRSDRAWSVVNAQNLPSLAPHERHGFREVDRGPTFAGITFTGGSGVLLSATSAQRAR
jgi:ribosomal protein S18 acetylase RimI-like enzyme